MSREQLFSIMVNKTPMLGSYILSIELEDGSGYCFGRDGLGARQCQQEGQMSDLGRDVSDQGLVLG